MVQVDIYCILTHLRRSILNEKSPAGIRSFHSGFEWIAVYLGASFTETDMELPAFHEWIRRKYSLPRTRLTDGVFYLMASEPSTAMALMLEAYDSYYLAFPSAKKIRYEVNVNADTRHCGFPEVVDAIFANCQTLFPEGRLELLCDFLNGVCFGFSVFAPELNWSLHLINFRNWLINRYAIKLATEHTTLCGVLLYLHYCRPVVVNSLLLAFHDDVKRYGHESTNMRQP